MTEPTADDIIRSLTGQPTVQESAATDAVHRAWNGLPSIADDAHADDIVRALEGRPSRAQEAAQRAERRAAGWAVEPVIGHGVKSPEDWVGIAALEAAKTTLRDSLISSDPKANSYTTGIAVELALEAAYTAAAEAHTGEYARLDATAAALLQQAKSTTVQEAPKAGATEVRTYTTMDGKETATFSGPVGGRVQQIRETGDLK